MDRLNLITMKNKIVSDKQHRVSYRSVCIYKQDRAVIVGQSWTPKSADLVDHSKQSLFLGHMGIMCHDESYFPVVFFVLQMTSPAVVVLPHTILFLLSHKPLLGLIKKDWIP